jgi:hypothetical protein
LHDSVLTVEVRELRLAPFAMTAEPDHEDIVVAY